MNLNSYINSGKLRRIKYNALQVLGTLPLVVAMVVISRWQGDIGSLKDPEFVPVYDENDEYIGITHPRIVESMDSVRDNPQEN
ncbi:hypothetical protein XU18_3006 [Perkinsela sp. CCAP 1560/4]|nr:hypothetical protein XU18_3006 [Perkinsela sp. CCAP 1560/4]|eukprot:KNH06069.1 hypothetical protein XU18_3006 [Perkinsela sp. CCAP 1560/4]